VNELARSASRTFMRLPPRLNAAALSGPHTVSFFGPAGRVLPNKGAEGGSFLRAPARRREGNRLSRLLRVRVTGGTEPSPLTTRARVGVHNASNGCRDALQPLTG
jgi:hypothetical protein